MQLAGISVDPPSRNEAMVEKLALPFPLLSDPEGELAKRYGLWNEQEGVAEPAIVVLDGSGTARHLYSGGTDFADRPTDEEIFGFLDDLESDGDGGSGEPEISYSADEAEEKTVRPDRNAITLEQLQPYYLGAYFTSVSFKKKFEDLSDDAPREAVDHYQQMINEYSSAIRETAKMQQAS